MFQQIEHVHTHTATVLEYYRKLSEFSSSLQILSNYKNDCMTPDRLAPLLAANHLASAMFIMFALQNTTWTRSRGHHTGVTEPFLVPLSGI